MNGRIRFDAFEARLLRKPIRHMYLRVRQETGEVEISAPFGLDIKEIRAAVCKRKAWVQSRLQAIQARNIYQENVESVWGRLVEKKLADNGSGWKIEEAEDALTIHGPAIHKCSKEAIDKVINAWRRDQVLERAIPLAASWAARLGIMVPELACRRMKSRWGTCYTARKRILLNSKLSCFDPACLELVIVHELGHLFIPHHGPDFRSWLGRQLPDWKEREEKLRSDI